jgi:SAM-dependent methyltransferase
MVTSADDYVPRGPEAAPASGRSPGRADVSLPCISDLPQRILRRLRRERNARAGGTRTEFAPPPRHDSWLQAFCAAELDPVEAACARAGAQAYGLFRELDSDLWALLLTQEYDLYPNIKRLLPDVPDSELQQTWNGAAGAVLAAQSRAFYDKVRHRYQRHSDRDLAESRVLDFGCGWGRLTRFFARDVPSGNLFGCDPVEQILEICRRDRVPATLARSHFLPRELPFDGPFDLAYAFSVFTHLSQAAHEASLRALHGALGPGGLLILTIRPPEYLRLCELLHPTLAALGPRPEAELAQPRYLFAPHGGQPLGADAPDGEITYGETVVTMGYVREHWTGLFELLDSDLLLGDPYQVMLTLRRRG